MKEEIENAVKAMTAKVSSETKADDAMKFSQAVLNLTHALATLSNIK